MHDQEPRQPSSSEATSELRIHVPTAASATGADAGELDDAAATSAHSRPARARDITDADSAEPRRVVGRSLAERLADPHRADEVEPRTTGTFALPDWSDPPTGLVPRVLLDEADQARTEGDLVDTGLRGPSWREEGSDWDRDADLGFLAPEDSVAEPLGITPDEDRDPYDLGFDDLGLESVAPAPSLAPPPPEPMADERWDAVFGDRPSGAGRSAKGSAGAPEDRRRKAHRRPRGEPVAGGRNVLQATAVGVGVGALAVLCFYLGPLSTLALVVAGVTLAAAELFSSLQRAGYRPATLIGLVAIPLMVIGSYLWGAVAIPAMMALLVAAFAVWSVAGLVQKDPLVNLGVTALVVSWTGILGSFAGMLLDPAAFPHRHGVAFVLGAIALTVAHDVGSYAVGARLGRHPLAPRVSPGKTREGLIGGSVLTLVVAVAIVAHVHPFSLAGAVYLGLLVVLFAPLGDLFESVAKRDLGLKDMGKILPAHGGIFDRIDAMLFVLPACYFLVRAMHLG